MKFFYQNLIKLHPNYKILSVITRRAMSACHLIAFNILDSPVKFSSYLDESIETTEYFISSLEFLSQINEKYEIVILDEINSLISQVVKDTEIFNKINSCFWIEHTLNFSRYKIEDIKSNDMY